MNITLITSVCYTPKTPFTYIETRSTFTVSERISQLLETIESIRKNIPNTLIALVECSNFTEEEELMIEKNIDIYINLINTPNSIENVYSIYKGRGEQYMTLHALKILQPIFRGKFLFKISGRYTLTKDFEYNLYDNQYMNFLAINGDFLNVNTAMYKLCKDDIERLILYFETDFEKVITKYKGSYEQYMAEFTRIDYSRIKYMSKLGLRGKVSVTGEEWSS